VAESRREGRVDTEGIACRTAGGRVSRAFAPANPIMLKLNVPTHCICGLYAENEGRVPGVEQKRPDR